MGYDLQGVILGGNPMYTKYHTILSATLIARDLNRLGNIIVII